MVLYLDCICGQNKEERKLISGTLEAFKSIIFKKDVTPVIEGSGWGYCLCLS